MSGTAQITRRRKRKGAENAAAWLMKNRNATYRQASERFAIPVNTIRSWVEYRYGSLQEARLWQAPDKSVKRVKKCITCKTPSMMDRNNHICDRCKESMGKLHDGSV
jgi:hypothetical protein